MTEAAVTELPGTTAGSKSEQAYQAVKSRIVEGTYTPGYRLVLGSIAKDLGFSVVPVREAIRRLEAEGLVKFERNVGATVAGIDPTEYLYTMQTLSIVEGAATALSAPLIEKAARLHRSATLDAYLAQTAAQATAATNAGSLNAEY